MTATSLRPAVARGPVLVCAICEVTAGPFTTRGEAELLAGVHDDVHHRGVQTAAVDIGTVCESCRTAPAVATWTHPAAGAPFALCAYCAATVDDTAGGAP